MKEEFLTRNQQMVVNNPYQGTAKRVLCVCSAGVLRSPTLAHLLNRKYRYNTRAAGLSTEYALVPVTLNLVEWATEVVVVEHELADEFIWRYPKYKFKLITLNVEDVYEYGDLKLVEELERQYKQAVPNT